jgi:spermidine synthase
LKFIDGIRWVKDAAPNSVDIITVDSTEPVGPALGLFSEDFYLDCFNCNIRKWNNRTTKRFALYTMKLIGEMRNAMSVSGFNRLQTLFFPQCLYPSGWWSATIASEADLTTFKKKNSGNKPFDTVYYNVDIHKASFAQPEFFKKTFGL